MIICDRGYLSHQRDWRKKVSEKSSCPVAQVETDVVIRIEEVSEKADNEAQPNMEQGESAKAIGKKADPNQINHPEGTQSNAVQLDI